MCAKSWHTPRRASRRLVYRRVHGGRFGRVGQPAMNGAADATETGERVGNPIELQGFGEGEHGGRNRGSRARLEKIPEPAVLTEPLQRIPCHRLQSLRARAPAKCGHACALRRPAAGAAARCRNSARRCRTHPCSRRWSPRASSGGRTKPLLAAVAARSKPDLHHAFVDGPGYSKRVTCVTV